MPPRSFDDHRAAVRALVLGLPPGTPEPLSLAAADLAARPADYLGRTLAEQVRAPLALPPFDNAQMDGFAVRSAELAAASASTPARLPVVGAVHAGDPPRALPPGAAIAVMTGAAVPEGADAVVPVETAVPARFPAAAELASGAAAVSFTQPVQAGLFVRARGSDAPDGAVLLDEGARLTPPRIGLLAGAGIGTVLVQPRLRVLLVSTGHELRRPGTPLQPGQIDDANGPALAHALGLLGVHVVARACRSDEPAELLAVIAAEAGAFELLLTVGGVSAGAREVVREALAPLGVAFGSVAMQPGGPQGWGWAQLPGAQGRRAVLCFPGNPVSALVSFEAFLRPAIRERQGHGRPGRERATAPLAEALSSPAGKHQLRRGVLDENGALRLVGGASSHLLASYAASTVLAHVPVGVAEAAPGEELETWRIDD